MALVDAEVAVVGLGAMGSAALWRLAVRGVDVLGFERFDPGHHLGSSHGATRLFRTACMEHPELVPLAQTSLTLWRELEQASSRRLLDLTGGLMIGAPHSRVVAGTLAAASAHGIDVRTLSAAELADEFPQHAGRGVPTGVGDESPDGGLVLHRLDRHGTFPWSCGGSKPDPTPSREAPNRPVGWSAVSREAWSARRR